MKEGILAALISGMAVLVVTWVQHRDTRRTIRAETERVRRTLSAELHREIFTDWQREFRDTIADLLAATDPEVAQSVDKSKVVPLVLRAQLMLNPANQHHKTANAALNRLALLVTGWEQGELREKLKAHSDLLEAARETMFVVAK